MNFETQVKVEIDYKSVKPQGFDYESRHTKTKIKYDMDVEYKSWGIKGISISAPDQSLSLEVDLLPENQEDYQTYTLDIELSDIEVKTERENLNLNSAICPQDIEILITEIKPKDKYTFTAKATAVLAF